MKFIDSIKASLELAKLARVPIMLTCSEIQYLLDINKRAFQALMAVKNFYDGNATYTDECSFCKYELPYHHGQCPKTAVDNALASMEEEV